MHLSPDEFYRLTLREFCAVAYVLDQMHNPKEEVYTKDEFFDDEEKNRIKDLKIIAARNNARWQEKHLEH